MNVWAIGSIAAGALLGTGTALAYRSYRAGMGRAEQAYAQLAALATPPSARFHPEQVARLPEVARRYFRHAISPGTPLYSRAELQMGGTFLLGDRDDHRAYSMTARQVLCAPDQFVWMPEFRSGPTKITGSDGLVRGEAWTHFWLQGLAPVVREGTSRDMVRSAQFRAAVESALWIPTTLLPENDVDWTQTGRNTARILLRRFAPSIALDLTLAENGAVREIVGQRWSNANREKRYREQPFGGTVFAEATVHGMTIPTRVNAGNHYGTAAYLPFFQALLTNVRYF